MRSSVLLAALSCGFTQSCPFSFCSGCDLNGGDLPDQPVSTAVHNASECAALCCAAAAGGCIAFSLNSGAPGARACYLKSGGWSNTTTPGVDSGALPAPPPNTRFPWYNVSLPPDTRVSLLVDAMTLPERISWLNDASPAIPRLGLPAYSWEAEALHGVSWAGVSTVFPANIAWGASFDVSLASSIGRVIAVEARAKWLAGLSPDGSSAEFAGLSFMTPNNNIAINPTWGRLQEVFGSDPLLVSAFTYAHVRALQFDDAGEYAYGGVGEGGGPPAYLAATRNYTKVIAVSKHFLAYHLESHGTDGQYRLSHGFNASEVDIQQTCEWSPRAARGPALALHPQLFAARAPVRRGGD